MNVRLLAKTEIVENQPEMFWDWEVKDADYLAEFAGRSCYQSWSKPNPNTARNDNYIKRIIDVGHFSVLEHGSVTFYIEGVSRSFTHELVRHRHFSFSQLSQRFVDESNVDIVVPPALRDFEDSAAKSFNLSLLDDAKDFALEGYEMLVSALTEKGMSRKQAREAARAVLPNMTETKIVVTGNHRAWREFLSKRNAPGADAEMQEVAREILRQLKKIAPNTYQDM